MAVIDKTTQSHPDSAKPPASSLNALTAAALALPGLMLSAAQAADNEFGFQYGHYQEENRNLYNVKSQYRPIEVDSLQGNGNIKLADRIKLLVNYTQDTWSGATPVTTAPLDMRGNSTLNVSGASPIIVSTAPLLFDSQLNVLRTDEFGNLVGGIDNRLVHTLSAASPETRKQGDFKLAYEWDEAAASVGGGVSQERDYESSFVNLGGRLDFNQKLTTLSGGLSYTFSHIKAILDHDIVPYVDTGEFTNQITITDEGGKLLQGNRKDWGAHVGLTQVLNKNALVDVGLGYTYSNGYMENPYKVVEIAFLSNENVPVGATWAGNVQAFLEQRPNVRNQLSANVGYKQYVEAFDAALHLNYRYYLDDWGINAHTFEADWGQPLGRGWTVTPRIRYYSQDAADFYVPYLTTMQSYRSLNRELLPSNFSSDYRLSGYGALSGGITISKQFAKGVSIDTGFEYYTHQGGLKLGGGGEGSYANFDYWTVNGTLKVNLEALAASSDHGSHAQHQHLHGAAAPAGVMFDHMVEKGRFMVGYRYMYNSQSGDMLHGSNSVSDQAIVAGGCGANPCWIAPSSMQMHMHMLDIMYAPTDWLNLMVMPQFMDMSMGMRRLTGALPDDDVPPEYPGAPSGGVHIPHHVDSGDETGGISDMGVYALFKVLDAGHHHLHTGLGLSIPFGDVDIELRRTHQANGGLIHYGMQLGSGTLDFKPSLTYTGNYDKWSWGAQLSGTKRLEKSGETGYRLGDIFQSTAWGGYNLAHWLSATVRGVYTIQGAIHGQYNQYINKLGPMDYPMNYGGRFWDVGFGLNAVVPGGDLAGNALGVEWLQPVSTDYNGYQLDRNGMLSATWHYAF